MLKKIIKFLIIILMLIGIIYGIKITINRVFPNIALKNAESNIVKMMQKTNAEILDVYTYGKALNIKGKLARVNDENIESVKLYLSNGLDYERTYNLEYKVENGNLIFETSDEINNGLILDKLEDGVYYLLLKLKLNNSANSRLYSFENSNLKNVDYYTLTKDEKNNLIKIGIENKKTKKEEYSFLTINVKESELPEDVYDIVIDAGHGGKDEGEKQNNYNESVICLDYAYLLKNKLEENGYKVKLTREIENTDTFTSTNMYSQNGRISIACRSNAKLMISLHVNNGSKEQKGFEVYCSPKSNLSFARNLAKTVTQNSSLEYSNSNNYKKEDGIYVRGYTKKEIAEMKSSAESKGIMPYEISEKTPYLYTIREVGGIATGAYVDGRNKNYDKNEYYKSTNGIECYQLEIGYIKNDLEIILSEKDKIIDGISQAVCEYYK